MSLPPNCPGVFHIIPPAEDVAPASVVFDSPHSGVTLPADFQPAVSASLVLVSADTHVEALWASVPEYGAPLLAAEFPRSFLDLNRAPEDIDPALLDAPWPGPLSDAPSVRRGMGLIWRYAWGDTPMYADRLAVAEVQRRIDTYWRPYHDALAHLIDSTHRRHGAVWHIDCHSMPATAHRLSPDAEGTARADIVLGDRDGTACDPVFTDFVAATFRKLGYDTRINDPFKGAELVRRHADPSQGRHSLQIEINRRLYMDEVTRERSAGFDRLAGDLSTVAEAIVGYAAAHLPKGA